MDFEPTDKVCPDRVEPLKDKDGNVMPWPDPVVESKDDKVVDLTVGFKRIYTDSKQCPHLCMHIFF